MSLLLKPDDMLSINIANGASTVATGISVFIQNRRVVNSIEIPAGARLVMQMPIRIPMKKGWRMKRIQLDLYLLKIEWEKESS